MNDSGHTRNEVASRLAMNIPSVTAVPSRRDFAPRSLRYSYCGNCVAVCPTNALQFKTEWDLREAANWKPEEQTVTTTVDAVNEVQVVSTTADDVARRLFFVLCRYGIVVWGGEGMLPFCTKHITNSLIRD